MTRKSSQTLASFVSTALACAAISFSSYSVANAVQVELDTGEMIELDNGVVNTCRNEGLNLGACACVVSIMLEYEGLSSMSLTEMTRLADAYPNEYSRARSRCISVN
ncbi:hypothetical protein [Hoeflea sp.]|uniref:hypothetical protein n=1 Tax=Hoeflea sp. TaxID=1940281 RepID=UPI0019C75756|nr:hypothetical protein [Hoeflea sp.]MBC7282781.1 hypothetical protein [Hoeflea sp.]